MAAPQFYTGMSYSQLIQLLQASIAPNGTLTAPLTIDRSDGVTLGTTFGANGNVTIAAPSSGATLTLTGVLGNALISASQNAGQIIAPLNCSLGSSGGDYPYVGYNVTTTNSTGSYNYTTTDYASKIQFLNGGFGFQTAPSGTAGNAITFTTRATIAQTGNVTIAAPSSGDSLTVNVSGGGGSTVLAATGQNANIFVAGNGLTTANGLQLQSASTGKFIQSGNTESIFMAVNGTTQFQISSTGLFFFGTGTAAGRTTGWGTPVGNAAILNYNITDAGGANSNTNKAVAQIIASLKSWGLFGA